MTAGTRLFFAGTR